jgi:hypothetical protein
MSSGESFFVKDDDGVIFEIKPDSQLPEGEGYFLPVAYAVNGIVCPSGYYAVPFWRLKRCDESGALIRDRSIVR